MCSIYLYALSDRYDYENSNFRKLTLNKFFAMDQTDDLSRNTLSLCSEFTKEFYRKTEKCLLKLTAISSHLSFKETFLNIYIYIYTMFLEHSFCILWWVKSQTFNWNYLKFYCFCLWNPKPDVTVDVRISLAHFVQLLLRSIQVELKASWNSWKNSEFIAMLFKKLKLQYATFGLMLMVENLCKFS